MAAPKLFSLKAEVAPAPSGPRASSRPFVSVRVDTGVFHLDELYEYAVPEKLSESAIFGVRVQVPFGEREVEGIIVARGDQPTHAGVLKSITKVLSIHPVVTHSSLKLFEEMAQEFACNQWDLIRSAIPPRVATVDKAFLSSNLPVRSSGKNKSEFRQFRPFLPAHQQVAEEVKELIRNGSILLIAPDERDVDLIIEALDGLNYPVLKLTASMSRPERYKNYLDSMNSPHCVVVGTRSAVFAPVCGLATIIIFKESSVDHFELRSPGWSSKSIAKARSKNEELHLLLLGFSPSIEVAQEIDAERIKFFRSKHEVGVKAFPPQDGALLPGRIFQEIRTALNDGPVLFLAARKGYGNALVCAHCKNIALCDCGGRLAVAAKNHAPSCVHCANSYPLWMCKFCERQKQYLGGRGIDRAADEIARAFPNFPVIVSSGDAIRNHLAAKPAIVLATPGAQPIVDQGYSAVVILDGIRFFSHTDLRSSERARELFLETAALIKESGKVLVVIENVHPIISAIARWNIAPLLKRELAERYEVALPPSLDSALLVLDDVDALSIARGLRQAHSDGRLPQSVQVLGPTSIGKDKSKIVLLCAFSDGGKLRIVLHELQRKRSIARKALITMRLQPYSL